MTIGTNRPDDPVSPNGAAPGNGASPQVLEREVERQREELARTVDALHRKLDVKAQARARAGRVRDRVATPDGRPRPQALAVLGGVLTVVAAVAWLRRR